jgi:hypothetical protein
MKSIANCVLLFLSALLQPVETSAVRPPPVIRRVSVSPTSLSFASRVVGSGAGTSQTIALTNVSPTVNGGTVSISSIVVSGFYVETNDCGTLAIGASCHIQVAFAPNLVGRINGAVTIRDNAIGAVQAVSLTGVGLPPVTFSPASLSFGTIAVTSSSVGKTVTLKNNQSKALAISRIVASGDYHQSNNCPASLSAGASCTIRVAFAPTITGPVLGALTVISDASPGTQPVALGGSGSGAISSRVALSPRLLTFGNQEAGTPSASKNIRVTNTSSTVGLTIAGIQSSVNYTATNTCLGRLIAPGGSCNIAVTFKPTADFAPINYPGAITVFDSDRSSPQVVALSGSGVPAITSSPALVDFGAQFGVIRSPELESKMVVLTNRDTFNETISIVPSGGIELFTNTCINPLTPESKCSLQLLLRPLALGPINAAVTVTPSSGGFLSPQVVNIKACGTNVDRAPMAVVFDPRAVGTTSAARIVSITNFASAPMSFHAISIGGSNSADFAITSKTCDASLAADGGSCSVSVKFKPKAAGKRTGLLNFSDSGLCSPQTVALSGVGQ